MSDCEQNMNFNTLVSSGSSLAYIWNNVHKDKRVKKDQRYKVLGGRITGHSADKLKNQIRSAIQHEKVILVTAGGNDIFNRDTREIRLHEENIDKEGQTKDTDLVEEIKTFMREIILLAHQHKRILFVTSIFPRYYAKCVKTKEYKLIGKEMLEKVNREIQDTFDNTAQSIFNKENTWVKASFLYLTPMFLEKPDYFFKNPILDPHLSAQGRQTLVKNIKNIMNQNYHDHFTLSNQMLPKGQGKESSTTKSKKETKSDKKRSSIEPTNEEKLFNTNNLSD